MLRWLYVDMNSFFASCEQQENPAYRGKPLAVVPMLADSTSCIAASYEAKRLGIKTGTRVGDAKRICPSIRLVVGRHDVYVRYHHAVREAVESCIPIHRVCSIDEICCELTGTQQKTENALALAQKIKQAIRQKVGVSMTCSIGLSTNILLSKIAADMQKPDGLTQIHLEEIAGKLQTLKLQDIPGIGARMEARLQQRGIQNMQQLLSLTEQQMRAIWGGLVGARYYRLLRGEEIEVQHQHTKSIGHQHVLPPQERNFLGAQLVAHKLISKAAVRLRKAQVMARSLYVHVRYLSSYDFTAFFEFHETQDTSTFIKLFNQEYSRAKPQEKPVKVSITLGDFVPEKEHQLSLFTNERRNDLFKAVDAINNRYGKNTVYVGSLHQAQRSAPTRIAFSRIPELDEI